MVDKIFNKVVDGLEKTAEKLKISYNEINVYGMFAWMGVTAALITKVALDREKLKTVKKKKKKKSVE